MKIQSLQKTIHYAVGVREKFDGQSSQKEGGQNPQFEQHQQDASQQEREAEVAHRKVSEPNEAKVNEAVESFQASPEASVAYAPRVPATRSTYGRSSRSGGRRCGKTAKARFPTG